MKFYITTCTSHFEHHVSDKFQDYINLNINEKTMGIGVSLFAHNLPKCLSKKNTTMKMCIHWFSQCFACFITSRPARISHAMPVLFLLSGPKMFFAPHAEATHCPDKRDIWQGGADHRGRTVGIQPKTVIISNFGHKCAPRGSLVCTIFTKYSDFVRVYR